MNDATEYAVTFDFGSVELCTWFDWQDGVMVGMSRRVVRDKDGSVVDILEAETGVRQVMA